MLASIDPRVPGFLLLLRADAFKLVCPGSKELFEELIIESLDFGSSCRRRTEEWISTVRRNAA